MGKGQSPRMQQDRGLRTCARTDGSGCATIYPKVFSLLLKTPGSNSVFALNIDRNRKAQRGTSRSSRRPNTVRSLASITVHSLRATNAFSHRIVDSPLSPPDHTRFRPSHETKSHRLHTRKKTAIVPSYCGAANKHVSFILSYSSYL